MDLSRVLPPPVPPVLAYSLVLDLLEGAATKPLIGQPKVTYPRVIAVQLKAYELGCIVGHVYEDRLEAIVSTFTSPGNAPSDQMRAMMDQVTDRLAWYDANSQGVGDEFLSFFVTTELQRKGTPALSLLAWKNKNLDVPFAYTLSVTSFAEGVAFGGTFPERFGAMWRRTWEDRDAEAWETWTAFGLPLLEPTGDVNFDDRCADVRALVEMIVRHEFPDLELQSPRRTRKSKTQPH